MTIALLTLLSVPLRLCVRIPSGKARTYSIGLSRQLRHRLLDATQIQFACAGHRKISCLFNFYGSAIPKSRQIFLARNLLISVCLGTADRRLAAGLPHQE
jgi:hypothetical protein